jgi:threonyl-tRNA synthetase
MILQLTSLLRSEYANRGYSEVMTPLLFKKELWKTSGHLDNYAEDMFAVLPGLHHHGKSADHHGEELGLKPMNCPGHCLMFAQVCT